MRSPNRLRGFRPALRANPRIGRNERGIERAFGEDGAEMVGQPEGDEERVRHRPGADNGGEHDVAHEAGQARKQRIAADGEDLAEHRAVIITNRSSPRKRGPRPIVRFIPACAGMNVASLSERLPDRADDAVLVRLLEISVHRQADHFARQLLADRQRRRRRPGNRDRPAVYAAAWCNRSRSECLAP